MNVCSGRVSFLGIFVLAVAMTAGCGKRGDEGRIPVSDANLVQSGDADLRRTIGDAENEFQVRAKGTVKPNNGIALPTSAEARAILDPIARSSGNTRPEAPTSDLVAGDTSLILGFPLSLLPEHQIFGGVITGLSDRTSESLGRLKLIDLTPVHVQPLVVKLGQDNYVMVLMGCAQQCGEASPQMPLIQIPIVGVDTVKQQLLLDLAPLGAELNLVEMVDPEGSYTKLKTKSAKVVTFDYSLSTLVFDIEVKMIPLAAVDPAVAPETVFTVRWYLKLASTFNPAFESRPATPGVGYFMTERSAQPRIQRFSRRILGGVTGDAGPVHYFVKNVPVEHQPAFKSAFDEWNERFTEIGGSPLLTYEFVSEEDPRSRLLVTGDIRYNILEWDLVNLAPYGGLGPSIANQFTGEILSANVLVQGPKIIELYAKWFEASVTGGNLRNAGRVMEADVLLHRTLEAIQKIQGEKPRSRFELKLGNRLQFRVPAQMPQYEDPIFARDDFEIVPPGEKFETYMAGYFHELVAHEMGHNVGLRHNFRGNLSSTGTGQVGSVSHSVMEYLGRGFRHLNDIGAYDTMALKYGYLGIAPDKLGLFCTDEDVPGTDNLRGSAECSRDDATADPFTFFEQRLTRAIDLLIARGSTAAPTWKLQDLDAQLTAALTGLTLYATSAEGTGSSWTNFFTGGDRPTSVAEVRGYVLAKIKSKLCDPTIAAVVEAKECQHAKEKTLANLKALQTKTSQVMEPLGTFSTQDLQCQ